MLREAILSVVAQTDPHWRLVVVYDPVDGTHGTNLPHTPMDYVESSIADLIGDVSVPQATVVHLPMRMGPGWARNVGVDWALAHGAPFVLFLDADDICEPSRLDRVTCAFERHPRAGVVFNSFAVIDEDSRFRKDSSLPGAIAEIVQTQSTTDEVLSRPWQLMACVRGYMSLTSTVAVRSEIARRCRFPHTHVSEDAHAWLRMFASSDEVIYLAERLTRYRVPQGPGVSSSRQRVGDSFYWTKALVDADACARVLIDEVAHGSMRASEAEDVFDEFWRKMSSTLARAGAIAPAAVAGGLSHKFPEGEIGTQ